MYLSFIFCLVLRAGAGCTANLETFLLESPRDRAEPKTDTTDDYDQIC